MTKETKRYRLIALLVILSSLIVGVYALLTINQRREIIELEKKVNNYKRENNNLKTVLATNQDLLSKRAMLGERLSEIELMIPFKALENKFVGDLKNLMINNNLKLKELKPEFSRNLKNYNFSSYYFNLEGSYHDWLKFLANLNKLKRLVNINQLSLNQKDEQIEIELNLKIYYLGSENYV